MTINTYHHGARAIQVDDGVKPIQIRRTSVIHITGTAPGADVDVFPLNKNVLIPGSMAMALKLGATGTLPAEVDRIFGITGAFVIVNRVEPGASANETLSRVSGSPTARTGVWAALKAEAETGYRPKLMIAPGFTGTRPPDGVASANVTAGGSGYTTAPPLTVGGNGFGARLRAVVNNGAVVSAEVECPGVGYSGTVPVTVGGPGTGATITLTLGTVQNPVAVDLAAAAKRVRAVSFIDGPGTTYANALLVRNGFGTDRALLVDGLVQYWDDEESTPVSTFASTYACAMQAYIDDTLGPHEVFSNKVLDGIIGIPRHVEYAYGDISSEHNAWNENRITIPVAYRGFRLLGARTLSNDPLWSFINVRRVADIAMDLVEDFGAQYLDAAVTRNRIKSVIEGVNSELQSMKANGWIAGGSCWLNADFNTPSDLVNGCVTFDFDIEPVSIMEQIKFRMHRNPAYYEGFVDEIIRSTL